jgi:hypothetical protein
VTVGGQPPAEALPYLVFAVFAFAAAVGLPLLVYRRPRHAKVLGPLVLTWVGGASMVTWGGWSLLSATANPELAVPAFVTSTTVEVMTGLGVAAVMAAVLVERFGEPASR